jgi:hypothetical protein
MENGISRHFSTSVVLLMCIFFGSPGTAHAEGPVKGCAVKYYEAARALDEKRAECGVSEDGQSAFCDTASRINIPVKIEGFSFNINVGAAYRLLSSLHLVPNEFRRAALLIQQSQVESGRKLKRAARKIGKHIPGASAEDVARIISEANENESLCADNHLLSVREIRQFVEDELVRQ